MKKKLMVFTLLAGLVLLSACSGNTPSKVSGTSGGGSAPTSSASSSSSAPSTQKIDVSTKEVKATDPGKSPAVATNRKDTLVVSTTDMSGIWSKEFGDSSYDWYACETMFDYLIDPTPDGKPEPGAATYTISPDGLTYTFKLKDNVKFWDGNPATANDVAFWLYVLSDPKYDGILDLSTAHIKGWDAYKNGSAATISGIKVVDDKTIEITLDKPNAPALWTLNMPLMEKAHYAPNFKKGDAKAVEAKLSTPMGTGPYKFVSYSPSTGLKLTANTAYFNGAPKIQNLVFTITPEGQELQSVQTGQTDLANATCDDDNMTSLKNSGFINAFYFPTNGYGQVQWNIQDPKYNDVRVREALAYGLNRAAVVKDVYGQYAYVDNVPIPMASWGFTADGINNYDFNTDKAMQLLNQAGWALNPDTNKLEKDGKPFVIDFTATSGNSVTDVMLPEMKTDYGKLGITVNIESADFPTLLKGFNAGTLDACFLGEGLSSPDPDQSALFQTGAPQNSYKYSNPQVDKLIGQEMDETDQAKRTQIFYQLDKLLNTELPSFPIYQRDDLWVLNARIGSTPDVGAFRDPFYDLYKCTIAQ